MNVAAGDAAGHVAGVAAALGAKPNDVIVLAHGSEFATVSTYIDVIVAIAC